MMDFDGLTLAPYVSVRPELAWAFRYQGTPQSQERSASSFSLRSLGIGGAKDWGQSIYLALIRFPRKCQCQRSRRGWPVCSVGSSLLSHASEWKLWELKLTFSNRWCRCTTCHSSWCSKAWMSNSDVMCPSLHLGRTSALLSVLSPNSSLLGSKFYFKLCPPFFGCRVCPLRIFVLLILYICLPARVVMSALFGSLCSQFFTFVSQLW